MPIYKIIKAFLIPPGIYISIFVFLTVYLAFCAHASGKYTKRNATNGLHRALSLATIICFFCATFTYLLSTNAVAQRFLHSLEYSYTRFDRSADAVIILGGPSIARNKTGLALQKRYQIDVIPSGYRGEAENIQKFLLENRVPAEKIFVEPKATNTKDHVKYIMPIALNKGYNKVLLVTDAYHMPRSMMIFKEHFKKQGIEVIPAPCGYLTGKEHTASPDGEWLPDIRSFDMSALAWHEYLGMLELLIFG